METHLYKSSLSRGERIGRGSYSVVFKGYRKDDASKTVAIKRIENDHDFFTENATKDIDALRSVTGHNNVVKLLDLHSDDEYIYIIMEYCEKGDLEDFLSNNNPPSYELKLEIMKQCARGVAYIHGLNPPVVHRDIKCNNILLQNTPAGVVVKIADFGLAKVLDKIDGDTNRFFMSTDAGSMAFRAPEMCTTARKQYNASVDIYALGLVFTVLINYDEKDKLLEPHTANEPRDPYLPYGMRQLQAHTKKIPMPALFFKPVVDEKYPQIKAVITAMTRFDFNQRTDILLIKALIKKECQENTKRNVAAEHAEAMDLMKSQHDKQMREMNNRFSTLKREYTDEVQRRRKLEDCLEDEKRNATAMELKLLEEMQEMNKRFSTLETKYSNEVQKRKELEDCLEDEKGNSKAMQLVNSNLDKEMQEMNKRFSTLETKYSNEVKKRKELEDCLEDEKGNSKAMELVNLKLDKDMQEMNKRFSMLDMEYSNGVQKRIQFEKELQKEYQSVLNTKSEQVNQDKNQKKSVMVMVENAAGEKAAFVTFKNEEDAARALEQGTVTRHDGSVVKAVIPAQHQLALLPTNKNNNTSQTNDSANNRFGENLVSNNSISVSGLDKIVSDDMLEMLFEDERRFGGGAIESLAMDPESGMASITFEKDIVAQRLISKGAISYKNLELHIQPLQQSAAKSHDNSTKVAATEKSYSRSIEVHGFGDGITTEYLLMFFGSFKSCGGGEIEQIEHDQDKKHAIIKFKHESTVESVLSRHQQTTLCIGKREITIHPLNNKLQGALSQPSTVKSCSRSIKVAGFGDGITTEFLQMFFSSSKSCGGGEIEHIDHDQENKKAIIKFKHESTVKSVLSRHQQTPLCIGKREITIHPLNNKPQGTLSLLSTEKSCSRSIEVFGFDDGITTEYLHFFFGSSKPSSGGEIEKIDHNQEKKKAIIKFKLESTVKSVLDRHQQKPLCIGKREITIQPLNHKTKVKTTEHRTSLDGETKNSVSKTLNKTKESAKGKDSAVLNCIEVTGIKPGTPTDFVQLFFENNKKSGGGGIESLNHNSEQGVVVITFKDEATCQAVISRHKETPICLESRSLRIQELDPSLFGGTLPGISSCALQVSDTCKAKELPSSRYNRNSHSTSKSQQLGADLKPTKWANMYTQPIQTTMFVAPNPQQSYLRSSQVITMSGGQQMPVQQQGAYSPYHMQPQQYTISTRQPTPYSIQPNPAYYPVQTGQGFQYYQPMTANKQTPTAAAMQQTQQQQQQQQQQATVTVQQTLQKQQQQAQTSMETPQIKAQSPPKANQNPYQKRERKGLAILDPNTGKDISQEIFGPKGGFP